MAWSCGRPSKESLSTFKSTDDIIIDETEAAEDEGAVNRHLMRYNSLEDDDAEAGAPADKVSKALNRLDFFRTCETFVRQATSHKCGVGDQTVWQTVCHGQKVRKKSDRQLCSKGCTTTALKMMTLTLVCLLISWAHLDYR